MMAGEEVPKGVGSLMALAVRMMIKDPDDVGQEDPAHAVKMVTRLADRADGSEVASAVRTACEGRAVSAEVRWGNALVAHLTIQIVANAQSVENHGEVVLTQTPDVVDQIEMIRAAGPDGMIAKPEIEVLVPEDQQLETLSDAVPMAEGPQDEVRKVSDVLVPVIEGLAQDVVPVQGAAEWTGDLPRVLADHHGLVPDSAWADWTVADEWDQAVAPEACTMTCVAK